MRGKLSRKFRIRKLFRNTAFYLSDKEIYKHEIQKKCQIIWLVSGKTFIFAKFSEENT